MGNAKKNKLRAGGCVVRFAFVFCAIFITMLLSQSASLD